MKIQTTLGELISAEQALHRLLAVALDARTRYHAMKLARLVSVETKHYNEERDKAIRELGADRQPTDHEKAKGVAGPITEVTPENHAAWVLRMKDLNAVLVEIPWGPLTHAMLEKVDITGDVLLGLGPLFELDPVEEPAPVT